MLDYKSMCDEELRQILSKAGEELLARRSARTPPSNSQHLYRIFMRRTPKAEPKAFRFTKVENAVVQIPLPLDEIPGNSGKTIGGEFLLADGDVVQKIAASGHTSYLIPWQGSIDNRDYDVLEVFEGATECETIANIESFVLGDRDPLVQELTSTIAFWQETLPEYDEKGRTDEYWIQVAGDCRRRVEKLQAMLRWARGT